MRACTTSGLDAASLCGSAADDAVLQKTPFGFDVSVWEFFWPLMVRRAAAVVAAAASIASRARLMETIAFGR